MITVRPEATHDCVYVELVDETSRVQMHLHVRPGSRAGAIQELRQIEVSSKADTVFAMDNVKQDKLPCDPHGLGGSNVYSGYDYDHRAKSQHDEDWQSEEDSANVDDMADGR